MMAPKTIIQTKDLRKIYQMGQMQVAALNGVDLEIKQGEFIAIMGPSGSGKSTMMNILGCLDRPSSGKYFLAQEDVSEMDKVELAAIRNRRIGFVFQSYNLLSRTSALDNVMIPLIYDRENNHSEEANQARAIEMLNIVGLGDRIGHMPNELSGGQQQRVAIARALINDPVLLLADEPTGNLDSRSGAEIMDILVDLHERGRTVVIVTHEEYIAEHAERIVRFLDGKIVNNDRVKNRRNIRAARKPAENTKSKTRKALS